MNLAIDEKLLEKAHRIGGQRTMKATVTEALEEYIQRRKQAKLIKLFGQIDFHPGHARKHLRRRS